jgi:hypothetical protein
MTDPQKDKDWLAAHRSAQRAAPIQRSREKILISENYIHSWVSCECVHVQRNKPCAVMCACSRVFACAKNCA